MNVCQGITTEKHKTAILFFFLKQAAWIVSWETVPNNVCMYMYNVDGSVGPTSSLGMAIKIELTDTAVSVHHQSVPITLTVEDNIYDLVGGLVKFNNT